MQSFQEANSAAGRGVAAAVIQVVGRRPAGWISAAGAAGGAPLAQAVALALEGDHVGVVDEPVDEGGGDHGVAEDLAPGLEAAVAGDDDRAAFVAARDEREEQVGGLAFERQVADLVDDEQAVALEAPSSSSRALRCWAASRRSTHCWAVANATRWPAWQALIASAIARWVLPVPGGPKKQTLACSAIQASWARCRISGFSAPGWAVKSKSSSVLWAGKAAWRMRVAGAGGVAREDLGLEQRLEELLVGPALLAGPRGGLLEALQHARRLELGQQVGQPLADRRGLGLGSCAELGVVGQRRRHDRRARRSRSAARPAAARGACRGGGSQTPALVAARVARDRLAAVLDPDPVAVEAQLDALMHERAPARGRSSRPSLR